MTLVPREECNAWGGGQSNNPKAEKAARYQKGKASGEKEKGTRRDKVPSEHQMNSQKYPGPMVTRVQKGR